LDALLLVSPTPFSVYGVLAMWGIAATAVLVVLRRRLRLRYARWFLIHNALALIVVLATVIHALQIEGAMEIVSKWALCLAALMTTSVVVLDLRVVKPLQRWRRTMTEPSLNDS
jgi:predicted ferric reductase